jgi:hypothetical protein
MSSRLVIDLFVEDRGHEELLRPLLERIGREQGKTVDVRVRQARGGPGRVLGELSLYQKSVLKGVNSMTLPDLLVVAIDANCNSFQETRTNIQTRLEDEFRDRTICACPDPHVERWYFADLAAFHQVVGSASAPGRQKCQRGVYKTLLANAITEAGHPSLLGGIEFARELVEAMDFYRAGKEDNSLKHFLDEVAFRFKST